LIKELVKREVLLEVQGETLQGVQTLLVQRDNLDLLEKAAAGGDHPAAHNLPEPLRQPVVGPGRDEAFWGFRQRLEAYTPAPSASMLFLPADPAQRPAGGPLRPQAGAQGRVLRLKALYLEPGVKPDENWCRMWPPPCAILWLSTRPRM